jgi:hypothetical protein
MNVEFLMNSKLILQHSSIFIAAPLPRMPSAFSGTPQNIFSENETKTLLALIGGDLKEIDKVDLQQTEKMITDPTEKRMGGIKMGEVDIISYLEKNNLKGKNIEKLIACEFEYLLNVYQKRGYTKKGYYGEFVFYERSPHVGAMRVIISHSDSGHKDKCLIICQVFWHLYSDWQNPDLPSDLEWSFFVDTDIVMAIRDYIKKQPIYLTCPDGHWMDGPRCGLLWNCDHNKFSFEWEPTHWKGGIGLDNLVSAIIRFASGNLTRRNLHLLPGSNNK